MFAIIIIFVDYLNECNNVNCFKTNTNNCIEKKFQIVDKIKCNELTKHVQKLQRNKFVTRFIKCFVNNNKMKIVEMTLQFEQYFKLFN